MKESIIVAILIPSAYIGKIELAVNAKALNITDIDNEIIEANGKISEVTLQGNKSEIEMDSNLDMYIKVVSHDGSLEINQLSATSSYTSKNCRFHITPHCYYRNLDLIISTDCRFCVLIISKTGI